MQVRPERTHWRDLALNDRHRLWGWDCPMVDIDFLALEYDSGEPSAIVEYKHENAAFVDLEHPSIRAIRSLANKAGIPAFIVIYAGSFEWWRVQPLNRIARQWLPEEKQLSEIEWVTLLYRIRGRLIPNKVREAITFPRTLWETL